jgi:hypothetical protein
MQCNRLEILLCLTPTLGFSNRSSNRHPPNRLCRGSLVVCVDCCQRTVAWCVSALHELCSLIHYPRHREFILLRRTLRADFGACQPFATQIVTILPLVCSVAVELVICLRVGVPFSRLSRECSDEHDARSQTMLAEVLHCLFRCLQFAYRTC